MSMVVKIETILEFYKICQFIFNFGTIRKRQVQNQNLKFDYYTILFEPTLQKRREHNQN